MRKNKSKLTATEEGKCAFFFIPDMSGFTKFIKNANLKEGTALIHDLLEIMIDSNISGLQIAEIQGDAILFYKLGEALPIDQLERQAKKTFIDFQEALSAFEMKHDLLQGAKNLTLKIVVHYGKVSTTSVRGTFKLVGSEMVVATKIMKNDIPGHEYLLMTEQYLKSQSDINNYFKWGDLKEGKISFEHLGTIRYKYVSLHALREAIKI